MKLSDVILKEELGVSRQKLSDFYVKVGGRNFAAANSAG